MILFTLHAHVKSPYLQSTIVQQASGQTETSLLLSCVVMYRCLKEEIVNVLIDKASFPLLADDLYNIIEYKEYKESEFVL